MLSLGGPTLKKIVARDPSLIPSLDNKIICWVLGSKIIKHQCNKDESFWHPSTLTGLLIEQ
jgi:hypothetical protein